MPDVIPSEIGDRPAICGFEDEVAKAMAPSGPIYLPQSDIDFGRIKSSSAVALHMHQPMIPAGGDNHNATVFHQCYKRMGEFIPKLVAEGKKELVRRTMDILKHDF